MARDGDDRIICVIILLGLFDEFVLTLSRIRGWCLIIQFKSTKAFWVLKEDLAAKVKVAVRRTMDVAFLLPSLLACLTGRLPGPLLCVQLAEVEGAKLATCIVCVLASSMMIG
jgi:hypothetical protein